MITILKDEQYRKSLLEAFRGAQKEILIMTYKCDYGPTLASRNLNPLIQELRRARGRDVKVWIILNFGDAHSSIARNNRKATHHLEKEGIIVKNSPPGRTFHAKMIIIDGEAVWIGSHNFSESSLCRNFEISLKIEDPNLAEDLRQIFLLVWYR